MAEPAWDMLLDHAIIKEALVVTCRLAIVAKSLKRPRRPSPEEFMMLMTHIVDRYRRGRVQPVHLIVAFAIYSTRRQAEIASILWGDLEPGRISVRDMRTLAACGSAHYWAREIIKLGHEVKLIAAQYVRPFVKRQLSDESDAEAE